MTNTELLTYATFIRLMSELQDKLDTTNDTATLKLLQALHEYFELNYKNIEE